LTAPRTNVLPKPEDQDKTRALGPNQTPMGVAAAVDADALSPGTVAGAYVLKREIASGGGGTVYEAQHKVLGRKAAVKVLRRQLAASPQMVTRFVREAQAVNMIKHPAIVDIYEFDTLPDGRPFYVMELLEGTDVRSMLNDRGRFSPAEVLEILDPVCTALQVAHEHGIVHRDLKASNIFMATSGGKRTIKLLDFGIAKLMHPDASEAGLTVVGTRLGTSYTMAPEQIRGDGVDPRTDVYALGVIFYEMLTGTIPFAGETAVDVMLKVVSEPVTPPRQRAPGIEITPDAEQLIMRALAKDPLKRQQSMEELTEELQHCYGSVRYRRSMERSVAAAPIPQRRDAGQTTGTIHTPPGTPQLRQDGISPGAAGSAPILLTRRKERKRTTLPMELPIASASAEDQPTPPPVVAGHDEWSEPALPSTDSDDDWADLDIDAPDGTSG
jgi:serine/threonine protein kinase